MSLGEAAQTAVALQGRSLQPSALSLGSPSGLWMLRYLVYLLSGTEFTLRLQDVTGAWAQQSRQQQR